MEKMGKRGVFYSASLICNIVQPVMCYDAQNETRLMNGYRYQLSVTNAMGYSCDGMFKEAGTPSLHTL